MVTKGQQAVRKLVLWRTNKKEGVDPSFPAFVVHWTNYNATRGSPPRRRFPLC